MLWVRKLAKPIASLGVLAWLGAACLAQTVPSTTELSETVIQGAATETARPNGVWKSWFCADESRLLDANATGIWFLKGSTVWR